MTYTCAGGSPASLEGVTFPGGRFVATTDDAGTTTMTPMLYALDHLGSVRSVVNGLTGETVETNDYYPFGGKWNDGSSSDPTNRYRYNGKEEQTLFSTPYSDYGARQYSSASAHWLTLDPLANKYYSISPYAFCANNPVNYVDPDGKKLYFLKGVTDKFKEQFKVTVQFMNSKGTAGDLAKLEASKVVYYITEASCLEDTHFEMGKVNIISWDPNHLLETTNNLWLSPATALAHEAAHAARYDEVINSGATHLIKQFKSDNQIGSDVQYVKNEEKRVITTVEQTAALKHGDIDQGQVTRMDHYGKPLNGDVSNMLPDEIQVLVFQHNILLK